MSQNTSKIERIADYFILKSQEDKKNDLTNKKLQKLFYYAQAWNLVLHDKKLFRENFEAWVYGPANPKIYKKFKQFGFHPIQRDVKLSELKLTKAKKQIQKIAKCSARLITGLRETNDYLVIAL